jgi:hypothetical protein
MTAADKHFTQSSLLLFGGLSTAGRAGSSVARNNKLPAMRRAIREQYITVGEWNLNNQQNTHRNDVIMPLTGKRPNRRMILFED